uniref:Tetraspanin-2A n=1 Tax=Diabrotica virgifera virgifera TaxID=50390 RepID=A0A6P7FT35_DIAVI
FTTQPLKDDQIQIKFLSLFQYIGTQVLSFIFGLSGSAVLLDNSARDSHFQPRIRESMRRLIMNAHHDQSRQTLAMIQENVGCCGADGATDYLSLQQPLPSQCRDTVTGNPFFHGCVDELTWFFEEKCGWIAGLAMAICMINVLSIVLSTVLIQALKKEEEASDSYRR